MERLERADHLRAVRRHLEADVLGWWLTHGPVEGGGVLTCWSNDGRSLRSRDRFTWSQGRWVWLMARAAQAQTEGLIALERHDPLELAIATARCIEDHAILPDGTTAFVVGDDGRPKEPSPGAGLHTSIFADLFVALGYAALEAVLKTGEWGARAGQLLAAAGRTIDAGVARTDPYPVPDGYANLALSMIRLNVATELVRATDDAVAAETAVQAARRIDSTFRKGTDIADLTVVEARLSGTMLARHRTPGHTLEALWFLYDARPVLNGRTPLADAQRLADIAVAACVRGWDDLDGGLLRYVDVDGGCPRGTTGGFDYERLIETTWDTKLWWPHAEALLATLLLGLETGRRDVLDWHRRLWDYTMATFPAGAGAEWLQNRDRAGRPIDTVVALPVKDPFHIARAFLLMAEALAMA